MTKNQNQIKPTMCRNVLINVNCGRSLTIMALHSILGRTRVLLESNNTAHVNWHTKTDDNTNNVTLHGNDSILRSFSTMETICSCSEKFVKYVRAHSTPYWQLHYKELTNPKRREAICELSLSVLVGKRLQLWMAHNPPVLSNMLL